MATYNGETFLKKQIDSILSQLGNDDELIISDDGSIDKTISIINEINDQRIKLYHHSSAVPKNKKKFDLHTINHYISFNFLNALNKAKGDYIFFSDQDDIWYSYKIEKCIDVLNNCDMVLSNFSLINNTDQVIINKYLKKRRFINNYIIRSFSPGYSGCAMAFRKEMLKYILPFPKDMSCGHDNWAGICVAKFGKLSFIDEPLFQHRIHEKNNSGFCKKSPNNILQKINWRTSMFFNILMRKRKK